MKKNKGPEKHASIIAGIAFLFAMKVLIYAAAFPLFNVTDELPNFDTAVKYSRGYNYYNKQFTYDTLTLSIAHEVQSKNYLLGEHQNSDFVPLLNIQYETGWNLYLSIFSKIEHQQSYSSAIYYGLLGQVFKLLPASWSNYTKVYALRFVNALFAFLLGLVVMRSLHLIVRDKLAVYAGGLLLIAIPQSIFYFINADLLSALASAATFYLALLLIHFRAYVWAVLFGLVAATTILIKASGLVAVTASIGLFLMSLTWSRKNGFKLFFTSILSLAALLVPYLLYRIHAGVGIFATQDKIRILEWIEKPVSAYFEHPMFTYEGVSLFFMQTWKTWWLGESLWQGGHVYNDHWRTAFAILTLALLSLFFIKTVLKYKIINLKQLFRYITWLSISGYFVLYGYLSLKYDFGDCVYPSKYFPFFVSGRLMLGMLLPFIFLVVDVLLFVAKHHKARLALLIAFTALLCAVELVSNAAVFYDQKNFYHAVLHL